MPVCNNCGKANPETASFCSACGAPLAAEAKPPEVRKTVTVLFSDLAGSTSIGESLDPERLRGLLTRYYDEMKEVLERHGGTVRELVGDAMLAVFGAPVAHEDDALRAVRAASEMSDRLAELNDELEREWDMRLTSRTGINTGEVVVEGPEAERPLVLGDAINVAARFQSAAEPGEILLGDATYRLVRDAVRAEAVAPLELKGKSETVPAWRVLEVTAGPGLARRLDAPLVGRERELGLMNEAFERTAGGPSCELVSVLAPAGVGKSRLTQEFLDGLGDRATVLRARCLAYGEGITFWPLAEIVRKAAAIEETDPPDEARAKIAALLGSDEAEPVAAAIGLAQTPADLQEIFWAARQLLEALAKEQPLVCVFDDVHWAEPTFLDLVDHVAGRASGPLLLLCLARPELLDARPGWATNAIVLEPLGEDESARLITGLLGQGALPDAVAARVTEAAEGNPLFVEELLRMLVDDGLLEATNGDWLATGDLSELALPPSINALLAARLDRLTPAERDVIQRAAVIGKVFWWGAVADLSSEDVGSHLQSLVRKELIRPDPASFAGEEAFRFGHILVRDAAYQSIPKAARAELHERFAAWLERKAGERASEYDEIIGYHLEQASLRAAELGRADPELAGRAGERLATAGLRARARGDLSAAASLLGRAVDLLPERLDLQLKLADALVETGELARAEAVLAATAEKATAAGDQGLELRTELDRLTLAGRRSHEQRQADIVELVERAIPVFEEAGDMEGLASAWSRLALAHLVACRWGARAEALEHALEHHRRAGDRRGEAGALVGIAGAHFFGSTPVPEAIGRCEEILRQVEQPRVEGSILEWLSGLRAMGGEFDEARRLYARSGEIFEELGLAFRLATRTQVGGMLELLAGDLAAAETELRRGYETLEAIGEKGVFPTLAGLRARVAYTEERYEDAEWLTRVSEENAAKDDILSQALYRGTRAKVLARSGDLADGVALAREAVALMDATDELSTHGDVLLDLAEVLRLAGRAEEAVPVVEEALALYEQKGNVVSAGRARALLEQQAAPT